jgi:hypothetical protein
VRQKADRRLPLSTLGCYTLTLAVVLNGCKLWVKGSQKVRKGWGSSRARQTSCYGEFNPTARPCAATTSATLAARISSARWGLEAP